MVRSLYGHRGHGPKRLVKSQCCRREQAWSVYDGDDVEIKSQPVGFGSHARGHAINAGRYSVLQADDVARVAESETVDHTVISIRVWM